MLRRMPPCRPRRAGIYTGLLVCAGHPATRPAGRCLLEKQSSSVNREWQARAAALCRMGLAPWPCLQRVQRCSLSQGVAVCSTGRTSFLSWGESNQPFHRPPGSSSSRLPARHVSPGENPAICRDAACCIAASQ